MSKLEELIKQLCPNGVKYKRLDEVFESFNGMTGVSNKWKENGNCQFIEYMNAYKNLKINIKLLPFATVKNLQQNTLQKGDILLTCASETPDECAVSSVIEDEIKDNVFLDDHLFGIRVKKDMKSEINTTFINYYMHTNNFRKKINKAVRGVTRFYISIDEFMKICIPVPPLEVQCEIVHILDDLTLLSALLSAELKARKKQYEYYKETLFENKDVELKTLKELATNCDNKRKPITSGNREKGEYPYYGASGIVDYVKDYIFDGDYLLISEDGANLVARKTPIAFSISGKNWVNNHAHVLKFSNMYLQKYVEMYLNYINIEQYISGAAQPKLNQVNLNKIVIPIPNNGTLKIIVDILLKFDKITNDISEGLLAEIETRQKQYEYYRDKLLTFKELKVNE